MEMNYERVRELNEEKRANAEYLGKWYGYLFWLIIPTVIGNLMTNENMVEWFPGLQKPGELVTVCTSLAWAVFLIKMSSFSDKIRFAGWGMIGVAVYGLLEGLWLSHLGIAVIVTIIVVIVSLVVSYHEYYGHAEVVETFDQELAEKWRKLWKWEIASLGATLGSILVVVLIPIVGILVVLVGVVALMVVSILKWVYIYQTKKFFEEYLVIEKYKDVPPLVDSRAEFSEAAEAVTVTETVDPAEPVVPVEPAAVTETLESVEPAAPEEKEL